MKPITDDIAISIKVGSVRKTWSIGDELSPEDMRLAARAVSGMMDGILKGGWDFSQQRLMEAEQ